MIFSACLSQYSAFQTSSEGVPGSRRAAAHRRAAESSSTGNAAEFRCFTEEENPLRVEELNKGVVAEKGFVLLECFSTRTLTPQASSSHKTPRSET